MRSRHSGPAVVLAAAMLPLLLTMLGGGKANADLVISSDPTKHVKCVAGNCRPTRGSAVLNVADLQSLLATSNVTIESKSLAFDIVLAVPLSWNSTYSLKLDSYHSIIAKETLTDAGTGSLILATNHGGTGGFLSFGSHGRITFSNTSNALKINGTAYTLVNSIASLASAVGANESGKYALANNYDASGDGTYSQAPIPSSDLNPFAGKFEGLGNTISHLSIDDQTEYDGAALFDVIGYRSAINNVRLSAVNVTAASGAAGLVALSTGSLFGDQVSGTIKVASGDAGGLIANNEGTIEYSHSSGSVKGSGEVGGLAGYSYGTIDESYSTSKVSGGMSSQIGGLVGYIDAESVISNSFATGNVRGGVQSYVGGLLGRTTESSSVFNSYAVGSVTGGNQSDVGGLIGFNVVEINYAYSLGAVSAGTQSTVGGLVGVDDSSGNSLDCYWDTDTSGTDQGTGNGNDGGITGLTTQEFQSGLPTGFLPVVWNEKSAINDGFPYLLSNVPPKRSLGMLRKGEFSAEPSDAE